MDEFLDRVRSSISGLRQRRLGERAVAAGFITPAQLQEALRDPGGDLGDRLRDRGWLSAPQVEELRRALDAPEVPGGLGRYELQGVLGEGAMSIVHRGRDRQLGRPVAVKILREGVFGHSRVQERFAREAQTLARLDHPNVVRIFDAGGDGGPAWLVMELVPGEPLSAILASKSRDRAGLLRLLEKVARGVHHAHEKGVIHRDLKPDNILVTGEEPKVADFGLAHLAESAPALTRSGAVLGTPMYMAPEQVDGGREITVRTDVYALGALLYEILTGQPPHPGASIPEIYQKIVRDEPRPPRSLDPSVPGELEAIALKALEKDPARRYPSALAFAEELRRQREGEPVLARPISALSRLGRRARKQRPVLLALLLAVLAAGTAFYERDRRERKAAGERAALRDLEAARPALEKARAALYTNAIEPEELLGMLGEARKLIDRALRVATELPLGWYLNGEAQELRGDYAGAELSFTHAVELDPGFGPARYHRGRVLLWRAYLGSISLWPDEREVRLAEAEQRVRLAIGEIEAAQGSGFDNELQREIASALLAYLRGDPETVHRICREGILRFGKKPGVEEFHWLLGLVLDSRAAQTKALDEALSLRPKFPLALYSRAALRDPAGAIEDYDRAIAISPGFAEAYLHRGSAKWARGDAAGAYADFDQLIRLGELLPGAYNGRGRTLLELMHDPDRALPDLDQAIRLRPEGYILPYIARSRAHLLRREFDAAIADASKAISITPWPDPFGLRGLARLGKGDRAGAVLDLEEALQRGLSDSARADVQAALERASRKP